MGPTSASTRQQLEEELLSACLELLNIKQADGAKLVDVSPGMFRKPNARALELILYHAYCVVKGRVAAKKNMRGLWPLVDKDRKQSKEFYQKIQEWLKESGQLTDQSLATFQRNPAGPKLVSFLCDLVHWALEVHHTHTYPDDTLDMSWPEDAALLAQLAEPLVTAAEAHTHLEVDKLLRLARTGSELQQHAESTAAQLKDMYYELTAQLRELQTDMGVDAQQPPPASIKLVSILPAQLVECSNSSSQGEVPPLPDVPAGLLQRQQEVHQLWQQLEAYIKDFEGLCSIIQGLTGSAVHPHAIDALQLRAHGQAGGLEGMSSTPGAALDIAALVEAWLFDVGSVCRYVKTLAGCTASMEQQRDNQQRGWLPVRTGGIGRCSFMSPLVASSDAASHATHLYAQLSLHKACRDSLLGLKQTLSSQADTAAARMQQLEAELFSQYDQEAAQAQDAADALAAAAAGQAAAADSGADTGGPATTTRDGAPAHTHDHLPQQPSGMGYGAAQGLFAGTNHLQLVPPTPMLQALAKQQRRQQHTAAVEQQHVLGQSGSGSGHHSHEAPTHESSSSHHLHLALELPADEPAAAGLADVAVAASGSSRGLLFSPGGLLLAPEGGHSSPDLHEGDDDSSAQHSPVSNASSSALPAAELLMSRELMDLDLVDDEAPEDQDDGGIFSTAQHTSLGGHHRTGGRRSAGRHADMARISFARFSLGSDTLSPVLAAAAYHHHGEVEQQHQGEDDSSLPAVLEQVDDEDVDVDVDAAAGGEAASVHHNNSPGSSCRSSCGSMPGQQVHAGDSPLQLPAANAAPGGGDDTPTIKWGRSQAAAGCDAAAASGGGAPRPTDADDVCGTIASAGGKSSPATAETAGNLQLPGSAECLSSAKPRRLTFAAAATTSADTLGSSSLLLGTVGHDAAAAAATAVMDTASSFSFSSGEEENGDVVDSAAVQEPLAAAGGPDKLALLRQRFASMKGGCN